MEIINGTKYRAKLALKGKSSYVLVPVKARKFLGLDVGSAVEVRFTHDDGQLPSLILTRTSDQ